MGLSSLGFIMCILSVTTMTDPSFFSLLPNFLFRGGVHLQDAPSVCSAVSAAPLASIVSSLEFCFSNALSNFPKSYGMAVHHVLWSATDVDSTHTATGTIFSIRVIDVTSLAPFLHMYCCIMPKQNWPSCRVAVVFADANAGFSLNLQGLTATSLLHSFAQGLW